MMKRRSDLHEALETLLINPLPSSVRANLLLDQSFCTKLGITPKFWFPLGRENAADADSLHNALRTAVAGGTSATLSLRGGARVRVQLEHGVDGKATLVLKTERFSFSDADLLASDHSARMMAIRRVFDAKPLLDEEETKWTAAADEKALTNREYVDLMTDLGSTPEGVRNTVQKSHALDVDTLIPDEPGYYQRLVAPLGDSTNLDTFVRGELALVRKTLLERHPTTALRRMAFSALWQPVIPFDLLASTTITDVMPLLKADDPFSLLFGFELCRDRLSTDTGYSDLGHAFLEKLLLDTSASTRRCNIFSAVTLITSIKLRQAARASNAPLFWVRLVALSHAGVLTDALSGMPDSEELLGWAAQNYYPSYVWHGVIDRRDAPRWKPDWASPDHIYAELVGRVLNAIHQIPEPSRPIEWVSVLDTVTARLQESRRMLFAFYPGPFDDFRETPSGFFGDEMISEVESSLEAVSTLCEVPGLIALAYIAQPSPNVVASLLRILNEPTDQPIATDKNQVQFLQLCAHIAASARSESLANAIIDRCFLEIRTLESHAAVTDLFAIMTEACAAYSNPQDHRKHLGSTATRLCYAIERDDDLSNLDAIFETLSLRDEKLIPALASARAIVRLKRGRASLLSG